MKLFSRTNYSTYFFYQTCDARMLLKTLQLAGKYSESLFLRPKKTFWREIIPLLAAFLSVMDLGNADTREA